MNLNLLHYIGQVHSRFFSRRIDFRSVSINSPCLL
jgi:hypothetical protein